MSAPYGTDDTDGGTDSSGAGGERGGSRNGGPTPYNDEARPGDGDDDGPASTVDHDDDAATHRRTAQTTDPTRLLRRSARRTERVPTAGGSTLHLLVLSSTLEDTTVVDLATRTVMRVRVPWPEGYEPDISTFDVVEVTLADDPERDDLARPEATTVADLPRHVGTLRGRRLRKLLRRLVASPDGPLLGFPGPSAPYWEFRGFARRWR